MSYPGLFPPPTEEFCQRLAGVAALIQEVLPLRARHREALPAAVRTLSGYLTAERDQLPRDYMNQPPLLSAYLHYFLPWNLYRQGRLLEGLDLRIRPGAQIVDLGAGPLTFLLALWLARPGLRDQELKYYAVDRGEAVLKHGRQLFRLLAGKSTWQVHTEKTLAGIGRTPRADLLIMANFINELEWGSEPRGREPDAEVASAHDLLLDKWEAQVAEEGAILLIEPGMRASGRNLVRLREAALARGWHAAAPCPHAAACPMPGQRNRPWCHFNFAPTGAPEWLIKLSRRSKLPKERASLSFLLLTRGGNPPVRVAAEAGPDRVRVVSQAFDLPDWQRGSYGCSAAGLVLLQDVRKGAAAEPAPGDLLQVVWPEKMQKDEKSGALIVPRSR